ncbi:MAG: hypothetical protein WBC33_08755 [Conexibacter sp.]
MSKKEMLRVLVVLGVAVVVAVVGSGAVADAEPAQQFSLQVVSPKPDGQVTVHLTLREYDTTGVVPPTVVSSHLRLPAGVELRKQFLNARYFCDGPALRDALDTHPSPTPFTERLANLKPFIRELAGSRAKRDRKALANVRVCERARLGGGTGLIDARKVTDTLSDPIPVKFTEFLSRGTAPGAVAGFAILGGADEDAPLVRRYPVLAGVHAAIVDSLVNDPTPDGRYGYKLVFETGPINGFDVSVAEVKTTVRGLKLAKGSCLETNRRGRCVSRQPADVFLFGAPSCPASGQLSAQLFTAYAPPGPSLTTTFPLPCPRFSQ